jgi:hypothetical protein
MSSTILVAFLTTPLKIMSFLSFHKFQVVANHIKWLVRAPFRFLNNLPYKEKWFHPNAPPGSGKRFPTQVNTASHTLLLKEQWKNRWTQSSSQRKQKIQAKSWELTKMSLWLRALRVGSRSNNSHHPKNRDFRRDNIFP